MIADSSRDNFSKGTVRITLNRIVKSSFFKVPSWEEMRTVATFTTLVTGIVIAIAFPLVVPDNIPFDRISRQASSIYNERLSYERCMRTIASKEHCYPAVYIR